MSIINWFKREVSSGVIGADKSVNKGDYKQNVVWVNNSETAMKIAAVYRAVNLISSAAASLTLEYKRKDYAKGYFKLYDTGDGALMNYMLSMRPNERMNSFVFFKTWYR